MPAAPSKIAVVASALSQDPRRAPRMARVSGFQGVQLDAEWGSLDLTGMTGSGRRELRHLLSSESLELVGLRADLGPKGFGPGADVDQAISRLEKVMAAAAGFSAPLICVDAGRLPEPARAAPSRTPIRPEQAGMIILPTVTDAAEEQAPSSDPPDPAFVWQVEAAAAEVGARADRYSVTVAWRSELSSLAALTALLRAVNCPWFGVDFDPVAVLRDRWDLGETLSALGPLVRHVRARDAVAGTDRRTRPAVCGAGDTQWPELLADLDTTGYHGWMTIDPMELADRPSAAAAGLARLRSLSA